MENLADRSFTTQKVIQASPSSVTLEYSIIAWIKWALQIFLLYGSQPKYYNLQVFP